MAKEKMWAGRFSKALDSLADDFNSSIHVDSKMYRHDITGSIAHATMLGKQGIISEEESCEIIKGLEGILADIENGSLEIDMGAEDIHMFVETVLTSRIGDLGKKLHTARSRNDQVALDIRMYLRDESNKIIELLRGLISVINYVAINNSDAIMPGYTHLQRAQPILFSHQILAYSWMFARDITRISDAVKRMNSSPLGACALAGTTYNTDRTIPADILGFDSVVLNSIDAVSDRDFCVELQAAYSLVMMHLSRLSEEIILWSSWEFKFIELDDSFTTGSSIMPQKKNSDMAELVRGKSGRVYGNLFATLTMLKGLPLAYNKDMQEDKEQIFDSIETVIKCLEVYIPMIKTMKVLKDNMYKAAQKGFINATDLADYLTKKGVPFRTAYKIVGTIVGDCIEKGIVLDDMPLCDYKKYSEVFENDLYDEISLVTCVSKRNSLGGTSIANVNIQISTLEKDFGIPRQE